MGLMELQIRQLTKRYGTKSWIVSKYVYGIKAHYKIDYQSSAIITKVQGSYYVGAGEVASLTLQ